MLGSAALSIFLLAGLGAGLGCATALPPPDDPSLERDTGIIVVSVRMHLLKRFLKLDLGARAAERVFMYRIDGDAPPYTPGSIVWSDQILGGYALFVDVPPGRYAIAGADVTYRSSSGGMAPVEAAAFRWVRPSARKYP